MKKNFKFYFAFILMALLLCTTNVYAVSKMVITNKSYIRTNFSDGTHRNEAYFTTNKGVAYCITPSKTGGPKGTSLSYSKTVNSGSVLYLLSNAGSSKNDRLITQLAIWKVNNNFIPAAYNKNSSIISKVNKLANTAKKNSKYSVNPTMKLSSSTLTFSESSDGNYYVSNYITVSSNKMNTITASVSGANGVVMISNGKSGSSLSLTNGSKFNVRIPRSSIPSVTNIKVNVKGTGNKLAYQRYSGGKWQDLVVLVKTPKTINATASGNVTPVVHKCEYKYGKYFDKNGNVTDKTTYSIQCEKHTCEKVGNTYFGKDGKVTDEDGYNLQCKTHTCEKVGNTYFGKDGKVTTEEGYNLQCKTHTCEKVGNTYFGKDGKVTDEDGYNLQCKTHTCEKVGNTYFGKDGKVTDEDGYNLQCKTHTCEKVGDTYFDKDGKVTDEDGYNLQCKTHTCEKVGDTYFGKDGKVTDEDGYNLQCKTHTCEKVDDKFFGKDGNEVTESDYNLQCKTHSCDVVDNKFFDKNGNEITEDEYNLQCKTHTCEIVGNKYFDENGNETDADTYKEQCEMVIEVPNTSNSDNLVFTVLGIITIPGAVLIIKNF